MANFPLEKQYALIEACRKAGIDVSIREPETPFFETVLTDEKGNRYKVGKNLKLKPSHELKIQSIAPTINTDLIACDVVGKVHRKPHTVIGKVQRRKFGFRKSKQQNSKLRKLKG